MIGRKKTLNAYRAILSWLHTHDLQPGDRLPAQLLLSRELGICQGTLSAAMQFLVEDKVLRRKQKAGTIVESLMPQNPQRRIWNAGIVMPELVGSGFVAALTMHLHRALAHRNFSNRTYFISPQSFPSPEVDFRNPSDFLSLETDMKEGLVDGLITSTRLLCETLPCVHMGNNSPKGNLKVLVDHAYFFKSAIRELHSRGCQNIFIIKGANEGLLISRQVASSLPGLRIIEIGLPSEDEWAISTAVETFISKASKITTQPCGVIIRDDWVASVFSRKVFEKSTLRPLVCLQTYEECLLSYPLPVLKYVNDLGAWSAAAVDLLIRRLLGTSNERVEMCLPSILQDKEPVRT